MGVGVLEIKKDKPEREFIFYVTATYHILHWEECLLDVEEVENYVKKNPIPKDKIFSIWEFKTDLDCEGFMAIYCEREETARYIADMLGELI